MMVKRGDTIIEVLLAMSVIGIVLGAAFGIANRSIAMGQDAQERTEALKIAESQLELFKSQYSRNPDLRERADNQQFCFDMTEATPTILEVSDAGCQNKSPIGTEGLYTIAIIPPGIADATGSYRVEVTWQRIGTSATVDEKNLVTLYFKPGTF